MATAGIILIGDELLSGQTSDANLPYMAPKLFEKGVHLQEVSFIPDQLTQIIETVRRFSSLYTYVFTTGGIGPTHDDITAQAVAEAFNVPLELNQTALEWMARHYGDSTSPEMQKGRERMATMPQGVELINNPVTGAAGFKVHNVFVMAGIPLVMRGMFDTILPTIKGKDPKQMRHVFCTIAESHIAKPLGELQNQYPAVEIGSYPQWQSKISHDLCITLKSAQPELLEQVTQMVFDICQSLNGNPRKN